MNHPYSRSCSKKDNITMLNSVVLRRTWLVKGGGVIMLLLGILSLAACQPVQRQASGTVMPDAAAGSTADRFAGSWAGTMSFDVDPNHKEDIRVVIPESCQVGAVCGSIENVSVQCTWEMTLAALQGDTFDYTFSNTLSGDCPARGGGKLTLQTDGTLMREHKTPDFTASGPLTRQE